MRTGLAVLALVAAVGCGGNPGEDPGDVPEEPVESVTPPAEVAPRPLLTIGSTNLRPGGYIRALAWLPGGPVLSAGHDGSVESWSADTGERLGTLRSEGAAVRTMAAAGGRVALGTDAGEIELWDSSAADSGPTAVLGADGGLDTIYGLAWSPDGAWLASAHGGLAAHHGHIFVDPVGPCGLCVWGRDGSLVATVEGPKDRVLAVDVSGDGGRVATGHASGRIVVRETEGWTVVAEHKAGHRVTGVRFGEPGELVTVDLRAGMTVRSSENLRIVRRLGSAERDPTALAISLVGDRVVSVDEERTVQVHQLSTGQRLHEHTEDQELFVTAAVSADGGRVALGGLEGRIRIWELDKAAWRFPAHLSEAVHEVAFVEGGRLAARNGRTIRLFEAQSGDLVETVTPRKQWVYDTAWSSDGNWMAVSYGFMGVDVRSLRTGTWTRVHGSTSDSVHGVQLSPDGSRLVETIGNSARVWTVAERTSRTVSTEALVQEVALFPDGERVALSMFRQRVRVAAYSGDGATLDLPLAAFHFAVAPDGATVAGLSLGSAMVGPSGGVIGRGDATGAAIHDATTGELIRRFDQPDLVGPLAISPDGRLIAIGARDHSVYVWELATGRELLRLAGHEDVLHVVAFSPDSGQLATGGEDTTVRVWSVAE